MHKAKYTLPVVDNGFYTRMKTAWISCGAVSVCVCVRSPALPC